MPVGLLVAGLVLFIAGVVVDDDHLYGPGVSIGIAGAVLFAGLLVVYWRRR